MKTNIINLTAFLLILVGSFSSCRKQERRIISAIDSEVNIRMVETLDSPRKVQFYCSTTKTYPCCNYPIYVVSRKSSNNIDISFKGVVETDICLTALGTASAIIDLGALSNGTYRLNLQNENVKHTGELFVSSESYKIILPDNPDFLFTNTPLNKIPEHTIWGIIGWHEQETSSLVQSFITGLMNLGAKKKSYNSGVYGEFDINKNGDIVQPGKNSGYWFAQSFIFYYSGNIANVEQLVKQYALDYRELIRITLKTDRGDNFLSWTY